MNALLVQQYIGQKRFGKYPSLDDYEKNLHLSKHCYIPLSVLEVSLRNAINHAFDQMHGAGWLIHEAQFLQRDQLKKISDAKAKIKSRKEIFKLLNHIRNFRNRIFHHERVFGKPEFQNIEQDINQILGYLHKDILAFSKRVNHVR